MVDSPDVSLGNQKSSTTIDYAKALNPAQMRAVMSASGSQLVIAGAGTGKTRTLVHRVAYLVDQGVNPQSILLITFTRRAAREMMRRASALLDQRCSKVSGGTFHSYAAKILRIYANSVGYSQNFTICDSGDAEDIINQFRPRHSNPKEKSRFPLKGTVLAVISRCVNTGESLRESMIRICPQFIDEEERIKTIWESYTQYKLKRSIMDYDDLLLKLRQLLTENDEIRSRVASANRYVMVDEFQDTNKLQAHIACLLASEYGNIMIVGDDAQSIYSFRGANYRNIIDFPDIFENTEIIKIEQNYRSAQPILSLANSIINVAPLKYSKCLFTEIQGDQKPFYLTPESSEEQAIFVCDKIREFLERGVSLNDMAVLLRSGWHSNELELELIRQNIPFVKYGGIRFMDAAHVKDVLAFLKIAMNPLDELAWCRVLLGMDNIGEKTAYPIVSDLVENRLGINGLLKYCQDSARDCRSLMELHNKLSQIVTSKMLPGEAVQLAVSHWLPMHERKYEDYSRRLNDLETLGRIAERCDSIDTFLSDIALEPPDSSQDESAIGGPPDELLVLSTIHSAKGLEWHTVFILSVVDGYLPSTYSLGNQNELEEERRLLYVAVTRAKTNLFLLVPQIKHSPRSYVDQSSWGFSRPSRFLTSVKDFDSLVETLSILPDRDQTETPNQTQGTGTIPQSQDKNVLNRINDYYSNNKGSEG